MFDMSGVFVWYLCLAPTAIFFIVAGVLHYVHSEMARMQNR